VCELAKIDTLTEPPAFGQGMVKKIKMFADL